MNDWNALTPEEKFLYRVKMDVNNLTGVFLNFPSSTGPTLGHRGTVAGIYYWLLQQERDRRKTQPVRETAKQLRHRLMEQVEKKIIERDNDDLFVILAV